MSNYLAIATVTAAIHELLNSVGVDMTGTNVTLSPLDEAITSSRSSGQSQNSINVFLYQVVPNMGYRNLDQPARSWDGTLMHRPQLGLNLHYLITALADKQEVTAHRILASAMRILYENPILTRDLISAAIQSYPELEKSNLRDQIEGVKISPLNLSLEELTKLWTSFFQINYRLSAAYEVSVVLIDSDYITKPVLPVKTPHIETNTFRQPVLQQVQPQILEYSIGASLTVTGKNFQPNDKRYHVEIQLGEEASVIPLPQDISDSTITITLPSGPTPTPTPGIKTVQVVHILNSNIGTTAGQVKRKGLESNAVAFVLAPKITTPHPIQVAQGSDLTLSCEPAVRPKQRVSFLIGDYNIPVSQREPTSPPTTNLVATIPHSILAGTYLLRIRIDGADSYLIQSSDNGSFTSPTITITVT